MCSIGALALYFLMRFEATGELARIDLTDFKSWFDIKCLTDHQRQDNTASVSLSSTFYKSIAKHCKTLGFTAPHKVHFGRSEGPALMELEGVPRAEIKVMGNWDPDTQESFYSAKMPFTAMRVMAGFKVREGSHYNPRTLVIPPVELQRMIYPEVEALEEQIRVGHEDKTTARGFLDCMQQFRIILLQDVAVMMHQGRRHIAFHRPVFNCPTFREFQQRVVAATAEALLPNIGSPVLSLHADAPMLNQRIQNMERGVVAMGNSATATMHLAQELSTQVQQGFEQVQQGFQCIELQANARHQRLEQYLNNVVGFMDHLRQWQGPSQSQGSQTMLPSPAQQGRPSSSMTPASTLMLSPFVPRPFVTPAQGPPYAAAAPGGFSPRLSQNAPGALLSLRESYKSVREMLDDWRGEGDSVFAPAGGIKRLEQDRKAMWRGEYEEKDKRRFRRFKRVVEFVSGTIEHNCALSLDENAAEEQVLQWCEAWYKGHNCSLAPFDLDVGKILQKCASENKHLPREQQRKPYPVIIQVPQQPMENGFGSTHLHVAQV
jgi:hypothetical protein